MAEYLYVYNGKRIEPSSGKVLGKRGDPYNPLGLPPFTIRCKFDPNITPTMGDSQTLVDATDNVWDITKNSTDWSELFRYKDSLLGVLGANTAGVTNMVDMFLRCSWLTTVPLFDTSSVTNMAGMFQETSLTSVPLLDTSSVTNMNYMFSDCSALTSVPLLDTSSATGMLGMFLNCTSVESGSLALYQQASTQTTPPSKHDICFKNCGSNTVTGAAELAQIPVSWGGTMA